MSSLDETIQREVDELANRLLDIPRAELLSRPNFGTVEIDIKKNKIKVGYWLYEMSNNQHHIIFKACRRVFFFLHKTYISGIVIEANSSVRKMNNDESGEYD